jgi:UDP:flavonoid glycosyltransferase YjiC (YdhE family)
MLNHAGLNSVLECIHFQVPMAVFPGLRDQPGNAVRALRHGVALAGDMATATPESVADLAARAMADPSLRAALSRLKRRIEADDGLERAAALVERTMEGREQVARRRAAGAPGVSPSRAPGG